MSTDLPPLLPCPFCGDPARLTSRPGSEGDGVAWVAFAACYCGGYGACAHKMGRGATKESAERVCASLWNTRAVPCAAVTDASTQSTYPADVSKNSKEIDTTEDRAILDVYEKLHADKLGMHWLWSVVEQVAAGGDADAALREFGYTR